MGRPALNLIGQVFGRLTVVEKLVSPNIRTGTYWLCKCECGIETEVYAHHLKKGNVKSCGCYQSDFMKAMSTKHGDYNHPAYKMWLCIKQRCYDKKANNYHRYGGRGIKVYSKWINNYLKFKAYIISLDNFPFEKQNNYTINRIDNNKNYEPDNINFILKKNQTRNREVTLFVYVKGKDVPLAEYAEKKGMPYWKAWKQYRALAYTIENIAGISV